MKRTQAYLSGLLTAAMLAATTPTPAGAAMIGTQEILAQQQRTAEIAQVQAFLARDDVRRQLVAWGVEPQDASARVASLTDDELRRLSQQIRNAPAGGDAGIGLLALIGLVFVVLIILDLTGVTHIFHRR